MEQKAKIPTLKDSQRPQVRIKGFASRLSLVERLKQFKKKDLAFILAGLGVLFMAPLAEHFMMSPENGEAGGGLKPGFGGPTHGTFGDGSSPYETGGNYTAPGGPSGGGSDVITPLNVRDPSALIMGPGAAQQPAATSTAAPPPPPAKESTDWKNAIADAAVKGGAAATKAASLPVPKPSLTNAALRGLGAGQGGGGGASWAPPPISGAKVPNGPAGGSNMAGVIKAPGYAGVGARGPQNGSAGSLEALKKAAANAGTDLNSRGPATNALEAAAGRNMDPGAAGGGAGGGGKGGDDKGPGGNGNKDTKSEGESLAFMAAKQNQQHAIDLYWKLKEKQAMMWPNLQEEMVKEAVMTPWKAMVAQVTDVMKGIGGDKTKYSLQCGANNYAFPDDCPKDPKDFSAKPCKIDSGGGTWLYCAHGNGTGANNCSADPGNGTGCTKVAKAPNADPTKAQQAIGGGAPGTKLDAQGNVGSMSLDSICDYLVNKGVDTTKYPVALKMKDATADLMAIRQAIYGTNQDQRCSYALNPSPTKNIKDDLMTGLNALLQNGDGDAAGMFPKASSEMASAAQVIQAITGYDKDPYSATRGKDWAEKHGEKFESNLKTAQGALENARKILNAINDPTNGRLADAQAQYQAASKMTLPDGEDPPKVLAAIQTHLNRYSDQGDGSGVVQTVSSIVQQLQSKVNTAGSFKAAFDGIARNVYLVNDDKTQTPPQLIAVQGSEKDSNGNAPQFKFPADPAASSQKTDYSIGSWNDHVTKLQKDPKTSGTWTTQAATDKQDFDATKKFVSEASDSGGQVQVLMKWGDSLKQDISNTINQCPPTQSNVK